MLEDVLKRIDWIILFCSFSGNIFILIMNMLEWMKNRKLNVSDQLMSGISFFEALYEVLKACGYIFEMPGINIQADLRISMVVSLTILSCNFWNSILLCVNFCLKIVNVNRRFYKYLQKTFSKNILWLLVLCLVASVLLSLAVSYGVTTKPFFNSSLDQNMSLGFYEYGMSFGCQAFISESLLGFLLSSVCLVAIITSLIRHIRKMQSTTGGFGSPNIDVHVRAIRTISFLLLSNILFFSSVLLTLLKGTDKSWRLFISIITSNCHVLNALNAIKGNSRLICDLNFSIYVMGKRGGLKSCPTITTSKD
uniref:Taste receptor type 2 n=1 Tax=Pyxicephalus adspersus TaxID=30357 RepID=A0AAV3ANW7_PYXAD|nr:TPA: hypothetical protein GDO54_014691 [Pyxicephalus adspersus]